MNTPETKLLPFYLEPISRKLVKLPITVINEGLQFHPDATDAEREKIFRGIKKLNKDVNLWLQFALGDAYNALPGDYGTKTKWVEDNFGGKEAVMPIKKCAGVAKRWPHAQRRMNFPWSFYLETAVDKFGINDREKMAEDYQAGKLTIEGIREIKREMDGGKAVVFDELDQEYWPSKLKNALRVLIQQNGMEKAADLLDDLLISEQSSPAFISENGDAENTENNAIFDDFPSKQRTDVGTLFADGDAPKTGCLDTPAEDKKKAWDCKEVPTHPKPLPRPSLAERPQSEKSDNKKEDSYCRNEMPGMIPFAALAEILFSSDGVACTRHGGKLILEDPHAKLDESVSAAVLWHEAHLLKLIDCREKSGLLADRIAKLRASDSPKMPRADALNWVSGQIEDLAEMSCRLGGNASGWLDPSDGFNELQQVTALRMQFAELTAEGNPYPLTATDNNRKTI